MKRASSTACPPTLPADSSEPAAVLLTRVLDERSIPMQFQPVIAFETMDVVGYEALARPSLLPTAAPSVSIADLHECATSDGTLAELDWICRASALAAIGASSLPSTLTWFLNTEPGSLDAPCPADLGDIIAAVPDDLRVVTEVTERGLKSHPSALLRGVRQVRDRGEGLAVDDVGVNPASLVVLPLIEPDVVKLDISLLAYLDEPEVSRVCAAVRSFSERSDIAVIIEGVETAGHTDVADIFGARYGQGFGLGRAGPLPRRLPAPAAPIPLRSSTPIQVDPRTPFGVLCDGRQPQRTTKQMLLPLTRHLERQVKDRAEPLALLTSFDDPLMNGGSTRAKYAALAAEFAFVATFSRNSVPSPDPALVTVDLADDDPLGREWNIIVLGPHYAAALSARSLGDSGPDLQRRFDYVMTYDRKIVERAARVVASRFLRETTDAGPYRSASQEPGG